MVGARYDLFDRVTLTSAWNPSKERILGRTEAETKNNRFLLSATVFFELGGGK